MPLHLFELQFVLASEFSLHYIIFIEQGTGQFGLSINLNIRILNKQYGLSNLKNRLEYCFLL